MNLYCVVGGAALDYRGNFVLLLLTLVFGDVLMDGCVGASRSILEI